MSIFTLNQTRNNPLPRVLPMELNHNQLHRHAYKDILYPLIAPILLKKMDIYQFGCPYL